jgi:hypothetical protein
MDPGGGFSCEISAFSGVLILTGDFFQERGVLERAVGLLGQAKTLCICNVE